MRLGKSGNWEFGNRTTRRNRIDCGLPNANGNRELGKTNFRDSGKWKLGVRGSGYWEPTCGVLEPTGGVLKPASASAVLERKPTEKAEGLGLPRRKAFEAELSLVVKRKVLLLVMRLVWLRRQFSGCEGTWL